MTPNPTLKKWQFFTRRLNAAEPDAMVVALWGWQQGSTRSRSEFKTFEEAKADAESHGLQPADEIEYTNVTALLSGRTRP